jgi:hypothetical protein
MVILAASFALIATQSASAARVYAGQPPGSSGFQQVLTLSNNGKKVTGLTFHFDVSCPTDFRSVDFGSALVVDDMPDAMIFGEHYLFARISGNKLSGTLVGVDRAGDTTVELMSAQLKGTLKKGSARGTVNVKFADIDTTTSELLAQCDQTMSWKALRKPGIIYGGKTSQDEPIVIELSSNRKRVSHAHVSWLAPCEGGGAWTDPHDEFDLRPFRLSSNGRFDRTYRFDYGEGTQEVERFAGKVTKRKASGTFRGDVTIGGAQPDTCTTGELSWRAATG